AFRVERAEFQIAPVYPILIYRRILLGKDDELFWGTLVLHRLLSSGVLLPEVCCSIDVCNGVHLGVRPMRCVALNGAVASNREQPEITATLHQSCASKSRVIRRATVHSKGRSRFHARSDAAASSDTSHRPEASPVRATHLQHRYIR